MSATIQHRRALAAADAARLKLDHEEAERIDAMFNRRALAYLVESRGFMFAAVCIGVAFGVLAAKVAS